MRSTSKRNLWPHADLMIKLVFFKQISNDQFFFAPLRKFCPNSWSACQGLCHERKKSKSSDTSSWSTFSELWYQYLRSTYAVAINDATLTCRMSRELTTNGSSNGSCRYCIVRTVVMSHRFDRKNN